MPSTTSFQFTKQDAEIVHYVYQLRLATLDHLAALTNRSYKALERRVPKLREGRHLRALQLQPHDCCTQGTAPLNSQSGNMMPPNYGIGCRLPAMASCQCGRTRILSCSSR